MLLAMRVAGLAAASFNDPSPLRVILEEPSNFVESTAELEPIARHLLDQSRELVEAFETGTLSPTRVVAGRQARASARLLKPDGGAMLERAGREGGLLFNRQERLEFQRTAICEQQDETSSSNG